MKRKQPYLHPQVSVIDMEPMTLMDASNIVEGETTDANVFPGEDSPEEILNRISGTSSPFPFF